jgi:ergothioneine biosynthesis protein EgtB
VTAPSRTVFVDWYRRNRDRSRALFDLLSEDAYYSQPIALRHPIVFYEGHLPAFSFNTFVKKALGHASIDESLERLFARGIDPHESNGESSAESPERPATSRQREQWPARDVVRTFADEADRQVVDALLNADLDRPGHPLLDRAEAVFSILEHEAMHQETLLYMWHRLPLAQKHKPADYKVRTDASQAPQEWIEIPGGCTTLGVDRHLVPFGWDNEFPALSTFVPAFEIERHDVTNGRFLEFVEEDGYRDKRWWTEEDWHWVQHEGIAHPPFWQRTDSGWHWRGIFEQLPLPLAWPVYVSLAEASAFARWSGARLPTEAEFQRAAYGSMDGERRYPWGSGEPSDLVGVFDFTSWDPHPAGCHRAGASAWGVEDLVGNGWEWTRTPFAPFPGFRAMASYPEYSADFFDGDHFVLKGASPATARELLRPTFRNWFRSRYPYVYATFRCVRDGSGRP